jgi:cytochrome c oxidase cbb3-type subunit III
VLPSQDRNFLKFFAFFCLSLVLFFGPFVCAQEPQSSAGPPAAARPADQKPSGQRPNYMALAPPPDPALVQQGQQLFVASCGFCHGSGANGGNGGPDLIRSVLVLHDEGSGTQIGPVIRDGRPQKGMPSFRMSDSQIQALAAFLLSRSQATAERSNYRILNVVTGDATAGETYFRRNCSDCHSADGDLAHVAEKYEPVNLQAQFLYPRHGTQRSAKTVTVTLPTGESWSGTLKQIDDFSVSLVDSAGAYHSWVRDGASGIQVQVQDPLKGHVELLKRYTNADMHNILAYLETLK